jgi:cobalt-zinc-cadmium efflux system protein
VVWSAVDLLREAIALNLDAAPRHVDLEQVQATLLALPAIEAVEALHIWSVSTSRTALTAHLVVDPQALKTGELNQQHLIEQAQHALAEIGIRQSTLQVETSHHHCNEHR